MSTRRYTRNGVGTSSPVLRTPGGQNRLYVYRLSWLPGPDSRHNPSPMTRRGLQRRTRRNVGVGETHIEGEPSLFFP